MQSKKADNNLLEIVEKYEDFTFKNHTTYGLGGKAKVAYFPKTEQEAIAVFDYVKENYRKYEILGGGSNVLAAESYYDGAIICTEKLNNITAYDDIIYCQSGVRVNKLLNYCLLNGVGGFEYLAGIPATVGGLALMNGGIPTRHIGEDIISVVVYDGEISEINNVNCKFGNKHSTMRDINALILGVNLSKFAVPRESVAEDIRYFISKRRGQPKEKNCGCIFKNPEGMSAGKLIDDAGLKGYKVGGAQVSLLHANFILNLGGTARDVYTLIRIVKQKVFEKFGVELQEEVIYIGEFNETDC